MSGSALAGFVVSYLQRNKLNMEVILNATLAGGVAIGATADVVLEPGLSILIGFFAGAVSSYGFLVLNEQV